MTSQWTTPMFPKFGNDPIIDEKYLDEDIVILLQGRNNFGDRVYSYLKLKLRKVKELRGMMRNNQPFAPSDFGTVIAAGKGEPTDEVKAEILRDYKMIDPPKPKAVPMGAPVMPKLWDEY